MAGPGVVAKPPGANEVVGGLVAEPVWEPDFVAVTLARRRWPTWDAVGLNDLVVAPAIGLPLASPWEGKTKLVRFPLPFVGVTFMPTWGVPLTVGAAVLRPAVSLMWMKPLGHIELAL